MTMRRYHRALLDSLNLLRTVCVLAFMTARAFSYEGPDHTRIALGGQGNYITYAQNTANHCVGLDAIEEPANSGPFNNMAVQEDNDYHYFYHFWDPVSNAGLFIWPSFYYDSAFARSSQYAVSSMDAYYTGNYPLAYQNLGRISHLIEDMGVPAHVHLDIHGFLGEEDWYEHSYIRSIPSILVSGDAVAGFSGMHDIMYYLATASDQFPSDDCNGTVYTRDPPPATNGWGPSPWSVDHADQIVSTCYSGAVTHTAAMLKFFYYTMKPNLTSNPIASGSSVSGAAINLVVDADSYAGGNLICRIEHFYHVHSNPDTPDKWNNDPWNPLGLGAKDPLEYSHTWRSFSDLSSQHINSEWVWIRTRCVDLGLCDSEPVIVPIKVDSEPPMITVYGQ